MSATLLALVCTLAIGGAASAWIYGVRLRREEAQAGIMNFAGMHWREFQRLIVAALERRGCSRSARDAGEDDGNVDMECGGQPWLLSTKHGAGYVITAHAVGEFANAMNLRGVQRGWMTTLGEVSADNRLLAGQRGIELLDGRTLWSEIRPLLDAEQLAMISGASRVRASRQLAVAWVLAAVVGLVVLLVAIRAPQPPASTEPASAVDVPRSADATPAMPAAGSTPALPSEGAVPVPDDPAQLTARRRLLANTLSTLSGVDRAAWATPSTLVVYLAGDAQGDKRTLCGIVERFPELRASRLQLEPPRGSARDVRFMQCRTY